MIQGTGVSKNMLAYGLRALAGAFLAFAGYTIAPSLDIVLWTPLQPIVSSIKWLAPLLLALLVIARKPGTAYALVGVMAATAMLLGVERNVAAIVIGTVIASSVVYTISLRYDVEAGSAVKKKLHCRTPCILLAIVGTGVGYLLLLLTVMYATMVAERIYGSLLSPPENIPEIAKAAWTILGQSPIVRILVVMLVIMVFYYVVNSIVSPLLYAVAASPRELERDVRKMVMVEARQVVAGKKWYHRMFNISIMLLGYVIDTIIIFVFIALFIDMLRTVLGQQVNTIALWALAGLLSMAISYKLAKSMFSLLSLSRRANWRGLMITSILGLASIILLYGFYIHTSTGVSITEGVQHSISMFLGALQGQGVYEPSTISLRIENLEYRMTLVYKQVNSLLGLIVELLWG